MKVEEHRKECKLFDIERKYYLIQCLDILFQPLLYSMQYEDAKDKKAKIKTTTGREFILDKKKILIVKACPFCGKILEDL